MSEWGRRGGKKESCGKKERVCQNGMGDSIRGNRKKLDALGKLVLHRKGYLCLRRLGKGAFSQVYCVVKEEGGRICACKISENRSLLEREARVMALLDHPLFPKYIDSWKEAGLGFLLSEYVAGCSMEEMLARRGHFTVVQTARVGIALAEGLCYLHGRQERFLFRDIKPGNIMIRQDGNIKLIDLGCVCSLEAGVSSRAGTPGFAAPEQLSGEGALTTACDVYGLGRTMEEMLGWGRLPGGEKIPGWGRTLGGEKIPVGGGASGWDQALGWNERFRGKDWRERKRRRRMRQILEACTRKTVSRRTQDMGQVISALEQL